MLLNEVFDTPVEWETVNDSQYDVEIEFEIGGLDYILRAFAEENDAGEDVWEIEFRVNSREAIKFDDKYGVTGSGNAVAVFSTVLAIMRDLITEKDIKIFRFAAKEPSRVKLYDAMTKRFASAGWNVENYMETGDKVYEFTRK